MEYSEKIRQLGARRQKRGRFNLKLKNKNGRKRINFHASNKFLYAQLQDDQTGKTLLSVTTAAKGASSKKNIDAAEGLAEAFIKKLGETSVGSDESFLFDRGKRLYHGRVKKFADALREKGLKL